MFRDVDVTNGPATGVVLIKGSVDLEKIPVAPTAEEVAALEHIKFVKTVNYDPIEKIQTIQLIKHK